MIPAIVLAAGMSTRMGGRSKALLEISGETFLVRIVRAFVEAGVRTVVIVVGHEADAVRASLAEDKRLPSDSWHVVVNDMYRSGQLSSLIAGLDAIDRGDVRAVLMTLVDVPVVSPATIRRVIDRYESTGAPVVRPVRGAEHGHPVLIDRSLFDAIRQADPAVGAKPVIRAHASDAGSVVIDDDGAFFDVDTPADYARLRETSQGGAVPPSDRRD